MTSVRVPSQLLRQTAVVQDAGEDYGDGPTLGEPYTIRCRIDWGRTLVRGPSGDDITVTGRLIVRPDVKPAVGSRVTIDGDVRTVHEVTPIYGPGGRLAGRTVVVR